MKVVSLSKRKKKKKRRRINKLFLMFVNGKIEIQLSLERDGSTISAAGTEFCA